MNCIILFPLKERYQATFLSCKPVTYASKCHRSIVHFVRNYGCINISKTFQYSCINIHMLPTIIGDLYFWFSYILLLPGWLDEWFWHFFLKECPDIFIKVHYLLSYYQKQSLFYRFFTLQTVVMRCMQIPEYGNKYTEG